jgi:sigma-E factor negative regulatory protein RseB
MGSMKAHSYTFPLIAILIAVVTPVAADPAMDWLQKMSGAMRNLSYRGNFVYLHGDQIESMEITHFKNLNEEKEKLVSLNGEAREVIRDNNNLTCIWPSSKEVVVDAVRQNNFSPIFIPEDIARLSMFYEMKLLGKERIADKNTVVVHIIPKDKLRYGMKFWINEQNGLMMKSSLLDDRNRELEQVMFTSISLLDENAKLIPATVPRFDDGFTLIRYHRGDSLSVYDADENWQLNKIPPGFRRETVLMRKLPRTRQFIQQMVYTDGLASLSVFIERSSNDTPSGITSMGAVNAYIRIVNDYSVTAIGEVPAITVKRVAESVFYQQ